jgi:hypothetical protein
MTVYYTKYIACQIYSNIGDFNFYRSPEDRNRDGANYIDMETFNAAISHLGLIEIPLKVRRFTWSNM